MHSVKVHLTHINVISEQQLENVTSQNDQDDLNRAITRKIEGDIKNKLSSLADEIIEFELDLEKNVKRCIDLVNKWRQQNSELMD